MKTTRDIKSSLEIAKKQRAPCRTLFIEAKLRKELKDEFGDILDEDERAEIEEKERRRVNAYNLALKKAKMKILRMKEKAKTVQEFRSGKEMGEENVGRIVRTKPSERRGFNEISFEY
jgi:hypothetical protein